MDGFSFVYEQTVDWGDMDAFNHVNNVRFFRYFESARIAYLVNLNWWEQLLRDQIGIIVASATCKYRRPVTHPDTLRIGVRVENLRRDRFVLIYHAYSVKENAFMAEAESLMVSYDLVRKCKTPLPEALRAAVIQLENRPSCTA